LNTAPKKDKRLEGPRGQREREITTVKETIGKGESSDEALYDRGLGHILKNKRGKS